MKIGKTIRIEEDIPMPQRAPSFVSPAPDPSRWINATFPVRKEEVKERELVTVGARKQIPLKEQSESGGGGGPDEDKPRCPYCNRILLKEMTPSGLMYLCIKHGYFKPEDIESADKGFSRGI